MSPASTPPTHSLPKCHLHALLTLSLLPGMSSTLSPPPPVLPVFKPFFKWQPRDNVVRHHPPATTPNTTSTPKLDQTPPAHFMYFSAHGFIVLCLPTLSPSPDPWGVELCLIHSTQWLAQYLFNPYLWFARINERLKEVNLEALLFNAKDLDRCHFTQKQDMREELMASWSRESHQWWPDLWVHLPEAQGTPGCNYAKLSYTLGSQPSSSIPFPLPACCSQQDPHRQKQLSPVSWAASLETWPVLSLAKGQRPGLSNSWRQHYQLQGPLAPVL